MILSKSLTYYVIGYLIVTGIASLHFLFNWKIRGQEGFDTKLGVQALKANATQFDSFKSTKPFHPIYNLVIFPIVSVWMINQLTTMPSIMEAVGIGIVWLVYCFISDIIFWIVIPHPWRLNIKELFITYQPWITLSYLAIFISPVIGVIYLSY